MSRYTKEKKKEHLALVKRILVNKPDASGIQVREMLNSVGVKIDLTYVYRLINTVIKERTYRYNYATKSKVIAEYEDFIRDLEPILRKIGEGSESDMASVVAIKALVENRKILLDKMMDFGLLERHLGKLEVYDVAEIAKVVEQINEQRNNNQRNTG